MAYSFQTFTTSQQLTSPQMNQIEANVRDHIHGRDGVGSTADAFNVNSTMNIYGFPVGPVESYGLQSYGTYIVTSPYSGNLTGGGASYNYLDTSSFFHTNSQGVIYFNKKSIAKINCGLFFQNNGAFNADKKFMFFLNAITGSLSSTQAPIYAYTNSLKYYYMSLYFMTKVESGSSIAIKFDTFEVSSGTGISLVKDSMAVTAIPIL